MNRLNLNILLFFTAIVTFFSLFTVPALTIGTLNVGVVADSFVGTMASLFTPIGAAVILGATILSLVLASYIVGKVIPGLHRIIEYKRKIRNLKSNGTE